MKALAGNAKRVEPQHRHLRPEVGAAYADVDDVGDGLVQTHLLCVGQHGGQGLMHLEEPDRYIFRSNQRTSLLV